MSRQLLGGKGEQHETGKKEQQEKAGVKGQQEEEGLKEDSPSTVQRAPFKTEQPPPPLKPKNGSMTEQPSGTKPGSRAGMKTRQCVCRPCHLSPPSAVCLPNVPGGLLQLLFDDDEKLPLLTAMPATLSVVALSQKSVQATHHQVRGDGHATPSTRLSVMVPCMEALSQSCRPALWRDALQSSKSMTAIKIEALGSLWFYLKAATGAALHQALALTVPHHLPASES